MDNNLTIPDLQRYIEIQAKLHANNDPYTIDYTDGLIHTKDKTWKIIIPDHLLSYIKLEEQ